MPALSLPCIAPVGILAAVSLSPVTPPMQGMALFKDLLAVEPIITLNAAYCEHHLTHCPPSDQLTRDCNKVGCSYVCMPPHVCVDTCTYY